MSCSCSRRNSAYQTAAADGIVSPPPPFPTPPSGDEITAQLSLPRLRGGEGDAAVAARGGLQLCALTAIAVAAARALQLQPALGGGGFSCCMQFCPAALLDPVHPVLRGEGGGAVSSANNFTRTAEKSAVASWR
jgi:hypothetical protein